MSETVCSGHHDIITNIYIIYICIYYLYMLYFVLLLLLLLLLLFLLLLLLLLLCVCFFVCVFLGGGSANLYLEAEHSLLFIYLFIILFGGREGEGNVKHFS